MSHLLNFKNLFLFCFYGSLLTIFIICLIETITYPGIFLNKTGTSLFNISLTISIIYFVALLRLRFSKFHFKKIKVLYVFSLLIIFMTILLTLIESFNYTNFVFSKLHINYKALQILSIFLLFFLISLLISKINLKQIFNKSSKILVIGSFCLIPILSYISWSQHLSANHITVYKTKLLSANRGFIFLENESKKIAIKDQLTWFFKPNNNYGQIKIFFNSFNISFFTIFSIIAILFYLNWLQNKRSKKIGITLLLLYICGIIYLFFIITICVTIFSVGELKTFIGRYILTYILALIMFSFYLFLVNIEKKINKYSLIYIALLFLIINIPNIVNLKPANKKIYSNRKKQESLYQKIKDNFQKNDKPIFHTIEGEGPTGYRYFFAPFSVISPIWQNWDIFMLENPSFKTATYIYLPSASVVIQKWSNPQIKKVFKEKKFIIDNGVYKIKFTTEDKSSFQLDLINSNL